MAGPQSAFSTSMGEGLDNLGTAVFGNPAMAGRLAYMRARASFEQQQMQSDQQKLAGAQALAAKIHAGFAGPQDVQDAIANGVLAGDNSGLGSMFQSYYGNVGGTDAQRAGAYVGAGHAITPNDAFSPEGQAAIRAGNQSDTIAQQDNTAGNAFRLAAMQQGHEDSRNAANNAASMDRQNALPVSTSQDSVTHFKPGDPRAPGGTVQGNRSESGALGQAFSDAYANGGSPAVVALNEKLHPQAASAAAKHTVTPAEAKDFGNEVDAQLGLTFDKTGAQTAGPALDSATRAAIASRAISLYQDGPTAGNLSAAVQQAIKDTVNVQTPPDTRSSLGSLFHSAPGPVVQPIAAPPTAAPAPAAPAPAPAAPAAAAPAAGPTLGATATNQQTGQKIIYTIKGWVPAPGGA